MVLIFAGPQFATSLFLSAHTPPPICTPPQWLMVLIFAGLQLPLSQLPNLESIWLVSAMVGHDTSDPHHTSSDR